MKVVRLNVFSLWFAMRGFFMFCGTLKVMYVFNLFRTSRDSTLVFGAFSVVGRIILKTETLLDILEPSTSTISTWKRNNVANILVEFMNEVLKICPVNSLESNWRRIILIGFWVRLFPLTVFLLFR